MMRTKTPEIMANVIKYIRMASVRLLSMVSMSLAKRLVIRPRGVVSKNDIGARITLRIESRSMCLLAWVPKMEREIEYKNIRMA